MFDRKLTPFAIHRIVKSVLLFYNSFILMNYIPGHFITASDGCNTLIVDAVCDGTDNKQNKNGQNAQTKLVQVSSTLQLLVVKTFHPLSVPTQCSFASTCCPKSTGHTF